MEKDIKGAQLPAVVVSKVSAGRLERAKRRATVRVDVKSIYAEWASAVKDEQAGNLAICVNSCLEEIRRLRHSLEGRPDSKGRATELLTPNAEFKYSMALLKWETHLAKLQGLLIGRVDVTSDGEPVTVVMKIPSGPFADSA